MGLNVIIWDEMLSSGKCNAMLSSGANVIILDEKVSSGTK
jgi:hypothetical protein